MRHSFLQTESWRQFQESVGHSTWRIESPSIAATVIRHDVGWGKHYLYVPYGPAFDFDRMRSVRSEIGEFIETLTRLGRHHKAMFIKVEPDSDKVVELLYACGAKLRKSSKALQPTQTVVLDLTLWEKDLLSKMHPKTRYNINLGERKGLTFEQSGDLNVFWRLLKKTTEHDGFSSHTKPYYQKLLAIDGELEAKLFLVKYQHKPIAAVIILLHGSQAYYLHGALDREYRNVMAPYFMHWQIIKYLKANACLAYDLWGIDAQRWPGVTRFKLGWGGKQVEYPGAFDLVLRPIWYDAYRIIRKIF